MRAGAHRESKFFFINIEHDAVFDGLSESDIEISDDATWDQKMVKIQNDKNHEKIFCKKIAVGVVRILTAAAVFFSDPNENFLETKMISEKSSTNPLSLRRSRRSHCNCGRDPMEIPSTPNDHISTLVYFLYHQKRRV